MADRNVEGQSELPKYVSSSLYIADLDTSAADTEDVLFELFSEFGSVLSVRVCYRDSKAKTGKPLLGHGYVNFKTVEEAALAWEKMNYKDLNGTPMRLIFSNLDATARYNPRANVIVKNLAASIDSEALYRTFAAMGVVLSCKIERDESGKSLEYGFIQFQNEEDAQQAIKLVNGMLMEGQRVYVGPFIPRKGEDRIDTMRNIPPYVAGPQPMETKASPFLDSTDDEADAARVQRPRPRRLSIARRKARAQRMLAPARAAAVVQNLNDDPLKTMYAAARLPEDRIAMLGGTLVPLVENLTYEFCKEVTNELITADIHDILLLMECPPALKHKVEEIKRQVKKKVADQTVLECLTKVGLKLRSDASPASYGTGFFDVLRGVKLLLQNSDGQQERS